MTAVNIHEIPKPSQNPALAIEVATLVMKELRGEKSLPPARIESELRYMEGVITVAATDEDGWVLATASMRPRQFVTAEAMLHGVVTAPSARGHKLGTRVIGHLEEVARERDIKRIRLTSSPGSVGFYEKLGYRKLYRYSDNSRDFVKAL